MAPDARTRSDAVLKTLDCNTPEIPKEYDLSGWERFPYDDAFYAVLKSKFGDREIKIVVTGYEFIQNRECLRMLVWNKIDCAIKELNALP